VNQEQFMAALGERNAEREGAAEKIASVMRAIRVQRRRVENMSEILVPGFAWIGAFVALVWTWHALSARTLAVIIISHVLFRAFSRVYINAVWIPRVARELARRFPEFRTEIEDSLERVMAGDDD
jgi:hypothetical protein